MKIVDLEDYWINHTHKCITDIRKMLDSDKPYDQEFVKFAKFLLETNYNPYGFYPTGWENSSYTASGMYSLLHTIHHAMVDDGEICWVDVIDMEPVFLFADRWEETHIAKQIENKFSWVGWTPKYRVMNSDMSEFVSALIKYHTDREIKYANYGMG